MEEGILSNERAIRLGFFIGVFIIMAIWEVYAPRRDRLMTRLARWSSNLGLVALNTIILRILFPAAAVGTAAYAQANGWGFLNAVTAPEWLKALGAVVFMDMAIYLQHLLFHAAPAFWKLHRMHHADLDYDVTTGARFHPVEIILSMLLKLGVVVAIGAPPVAVLIFEVVLNAMAMFNHGNVRLPQAIDEKLRLILVTPDMHRVHHSVVIHEANSNYGFNLSIWDRLFGTYIAQPAAGHEQMTIGVTGLLDSAENTLPRMLIQPFSGKSEDYAINRQR